ncbi:MAG: SMC-Scp complex subunit ScpB [Gammaproteobacteria bacterium]|nr:SMC-Scp complex subunit ScpB [Gammaproteobacteria bacterium]
MTTDLPSIELIIEAALLSSDEPLSLDQLLKLFDQQKQPDTLLVQEALEKLRQQYADRSIALKETASGFQFQIKNEYTSYIQRLWEEKPQTYSHAMLETLAIIAYRQPITRGEIEAIRGVSVNSYMIKMLTEHGWIRRIGHRDLPGKPGLYATTKQFLDHFGLKKLDELPPLKAFEQKIEQNPM